MADRDIFTVHVEQGWRNPVRRLLRGEHDDWSIGTVLKPLANFIREGGCPELASIARVISESDESNAGSSVAVAMELLDLEATGAHRNLQFAIRSFQRLISSPADPGSSRLSRDITTAGIQKLVAEGFLLEILRSNILVIPVLQELAEQNGLPFHDQVSNAEKALDRIRVDARFQRMVRELAMDPSGAAVSWPENVRREVDQARILSTPVEVE